MKKLLIAAVLSGLSFGIFAQETVLSSASTAFSFMNIGVGARAAGMGEAYTALSDDMSSVYWNPAGLSKVKSVQLGLTYGQMFVDSSYQYIMGGLPLGPGAAGFNISYLRYGSFELRDLSGAILSASAQPYNMAASAAYGLEIIPGISAGAAVKYLSQDINSSMLSGFGFDLGVTGKYDIYSAGIFAGNIGSAGSFSMPVNIRAGLAANITVNEKNAVIIAADAAYPMSGSVKINLGAEYSWADMLSVRAGYTFKEENSSLKGFAGVSGGLGIKLADFRIDYAIVPFGDLGTVNDFTLSYNFSNNNNDKPAITPGNTDDFARLSKRADDLAGSGSYEGAASFYKEAISFKKDATIYRKLGDCYYKLKNREMTVYYYERSLEIKDDPKLAEWVEKNRAPAR